MELSDYMKKYAEYVKVEATVPGLDGIEETTKKDLLGIIKAARAGQPACLPRRFIDIMHANGSVNGSEQTDETVRILQWNLLAQGLCLGKDNFILCPAAVLEWQHRRLLILEEILNSEADVLCLEEVDHFWFLKDILGLAGYEGIYLPKPDSPSLYVANSDGPDGCAVFYDKSKFTLVKTDLVNLRTLENFTTNQVCLLAVLCPVHAPEKHFCVGAVHLKAKEGWSDLRLSQGSFLLKYLEAAYKDLPLVICGDFNADCKEPVYSAFSQSSLNLQSAYCHLSEENKEPLYTTWKIRGCPSGKNTEVCRTIDYMWVTKDRLKTKALYSIPMPKEIGESRLPSPTYPSDHLALGVELLIL